MKKIDLANINENTERDFTDEIKIIETYVPLSLQTDKKYFIKRLNEINEYLKKE